ncbi:uncharacterized protein M421DRAFT_426449 [Didymella exigua CBS 183.55]|uniref:Cell wall mannoprotein PIR1-like C-terminal domain-containing protein n=1 Tax=Didymella exigua CBS 183.55 TaxID=1150837 RepID=A0A6A5R772_9PLEO|nr:uncharacterized protein M421DRAFT_426449 [Didymella exigua CBS 183.55]KAF1922824.1 hypothetical protein M421DRAFT_426449 [Didymella exigua CBS 183.55]
MRASSFLAPLIFATQSLAQAVEEGIAPSSPAPAGCETTVKGNFTISVENSFSARSKRETAQEASDGALLCTLEDGILRDQYSRTGSVVANRQFQFDGPPQAGAIYTGGFSVCQNNSLAIGGTTRWWRCMSGTFGNLYDESIGDQCSEIRIVVGFVDSSPSSSLVLSASSTLSSISTGGASVTLSSTTSGSPSAASNSASNSTAQPVASASSSRAAASGSASELTSGSATGSASGSSSATASGAAPPASGGAAAVFSSVVPTTCLAALLAVFGAALIL